MRRSQSYNSFARFVPILLVIIITIVVIAAIIAIGRALFGGETQQTQTTTTTDAGRDALLSTDVNRAVRVTVRGPIVAQEKFRSYRVMASPQARSMVTYEGYMDKQLDAKQLDNNPKAYEELVYALEKRKMMEGRQLSDAQNDLRGICATGKVYIFETLYNGQPVKTLWTSDCSGSKGSAVASTEEIIDMMLKQIPDGSKMASSVGLYQKENFFRL